MDEIRVADRDIEPELLEGGPAILSLATGTPGAGHTQEEIYEQFLRPYLGEHPRARAIFRQAAIAHRHTVVDGAYYAVERGTEARNQRYLAEALPLGRDTITRCLDAAGVSPQDVDDFSVVSCTGFDIPGLDLRLAGELGMRADLSRTCVLGMGCYAAFPALRRAWEATMVRPGRLALVLALELCSLHFQPGDGSTENVVVSALFADGAAAVLIGQAGRTGAAGAGGSGWPWLIDSATHCDYRTFEHMAFHLTDHGFRMRLSAYVPELLSARIEDFVDGLLERNGLRRADVRFWGLHPGGAKIIDHVQERLGLADADLAFSRRVLRDFGNMSSPTVLFVLDEICRSGSPRPGDCGLLLAFGPGLTLEGALVRW